MVLACGAHVCPLGCLQVALDVDKDLYDKFTMRHNIDLLLMELWKVWGVPGGAGAGRGGSEGGLEGGWVGGKRVPQGWVWR